ncbi:MAG: RNA polymerase sigma factor [Mucilaginibacter sp.]|uniref:RNA polymerase sigma factor n=1 Tax=Mucilaginibacter sp. TaxID=1882438 RepID=UPI0034E4707E
MYDDKELISRILNGELSAFSLLVNQHEKLVVHMIGRIVQRLEDREDICQEVFLKVYKNLASFKFQSKLSTWIAQIAYGTAIKHLKKYNNKPLNDLLDLEDRHSTDVNPENILAKKDYYKFLHAEINKLPLQYKVVLTLYHLNEFSYQEIEEITGMPSGTVKNYLFRARKLLKDNLEKHLK